MNAARCLSMRFEVRRLDREITRQLRYVANRPEYRPSRRMDEINRLQEKRNFLKEYLDEYKKEEYNDR